MVAEEKPTILLLREIADRYGVSHNTVRNWIVEGVRGVGGDTHRLRAVRIGGRYFVESRWLDEYMERLQGEPVTGE